MTQGEPVLVGDLRAVTLADVDQAPRPTARLGRYAVWQLYDYARGVGGATLVLSGLAITMLTMSGLGRMSHSLAVQSSVTGLLGTLGFLGPIFACSGLVADDRSKGYYRFLLAKPVSPVRFYGQAFLLRGAAFLGISVAALWLALRAVLPPFHLISALQSPGAIAWFAGYGVLAIAAALTVIRGREWPL